jgi:hypothetical protein
VFEVVVLAVGPLAVVDLVDMVCVVERYTVRVPLNPDVQPKASAVSSGQKKVWQSGDPVGLFVFISSQFSPPKKTT